ncbi:MAG: DUF6873 family GME fold protein [Bacillota bacterium]
MNYINVPNLPDKNVRLALVDGRISPGLERGLCSNGVTLIKTYAHSALYPAISFHPDIVLHHIGDKLLVFAPGTNENTLRALTGLGFSLIKGNSELTSKYPGNICYNVARVGNFAFHNTKYTDSVLRENLYKMGVEFVHVNQGYAKCAVSIADENSIITMDAGIAKAAERKGLDALVIEESKIRLPSLDKGFIGGSTCLIDKKRWALAGDLEKLDSSAKIYDFLTAKGIEIVSLSQDQVIDVGSIIPLATF